MSPNEFLRQIARQQPEPAYLFTGPESYMREKCRRALIDRALPSDQHEHGLTRFDLTQDDLSTVIDDARSLSLFASERVIWASSAEAALPKGRSTDSEEEEGAGKGSSAAEVSDLLKNPAPGVTVVFDCSRFDFEGEDKTKLQRVQKFYGAIRAQVEFPRLSPAEARSLAQQLATEVSLNIGSGELDLLVDVLAADASRLANEIEKLSIFAGNRRVTAEDVWNLVPNAKSATIFQLVAAIGRGHRQASLEALDILVREGEYLPLALSFLATQFRLALAAKEAKLTSVNQIQSHFTKLGTPMWRSRAEQVYQTMTAFPAGKMKTAIVKVYEADKALRDARPDDRTIMEQFVLTLT